jgi:hypothetical protein
MLCSAAASTRRFAPWRLRMRGKTLVNCFKRTPACLRRSS